MRRSLLLAVLLLGACAGNRQYFEPTERVHGETLHGYREAIYPLLGPAGQFGEAKLWSRGAYKHGERTVVQVGMQLRNTSAETFELRAADVWLEPVAVDDGVVQRVVAAERNDVVFAPQAVGPASFHFVMPLGIAPSDVIAFRLRWTVRSADRAFTENTAFRREPRTIDYLPGRYAGYGYGYALCPPFDPYCYEPPPYSYVPPPARYPGPRSRVVVRPER